MPREGGVSSVMVEAGVRRVQEVTGRPDWRPVELVQAILTAATRRHFCTLHSHPGAPACTPGVCRSYCGITYHGELFSDAGPRRVVPAGTCPACFGAWDMEVRRAA